MNYKLEKFWNTSYFKEHFSSSSWTINLKSFEMEVDDFYTNVTEKMNYKLEKFWNNKYMSWVYQDIANEL